MGEGARRLAVMAVVGAATVAGAQEPRLVVPIYDYGRYVTGETASDATPIPATFDHEEADGRRRVRPISELRPLLTGCKRSVTEISGGSYKWTGACPGMPAGQQLLLTIAGTRAAVTKVSLRAGTGPLLIPPAPPGPPRR